MARASASAPDLGAIFEEHFDYLWNRLRRLGVREADLEDLVHEVFIKVHARPMSASGGEATAPVRSSHRGGTGVSSEETAA